MEQALTEPARTVEYNTPTMSFGEVGYIGEQSMGGYASVAHGVGEFTDNEIVERMAHLHDEAWAITDPVGLLHTMDIDKALREIPRNADVFRQYRYYRGDIEVTVRMNTNQFYYGALMVTLYPGGTTIGPKLDTRAVLDPTIISASCGESVIKEWQYQWPLAWKPTSGSIVDLLPTTLSLDVVAPLTAGKASMPSAITVQIWARFKNVKLSYPFYIPGQMKRSESKKTTVIYGERCDGDESHSAKGGSPIVIYPQKEQSYHPRKKYKGKEEPANTLDKAVKAVESITIKDAWDGISSLVSTAATYLGEAASFILDKPNLEVSQMPTNIEGCQDLFTTDLPDTNVSVGMHHGKYVDPGPDRMPMSKDWTISQYAQIPGLRIPLQTFTAEGQSVNTFLVMSHPTTSTYRIPLDWAWLNAMQYRGSIRVCLMFFTSSFISARFVVQYINGNEYPAGFATDYDDGISRVINVKGDTTDTFMCPWLARNWWGRVPEGQISVTCDSVIASADTSVSPKIYMIMWVAGGEDIQFAFPRQVRPGEWGPSTSITDPNGTTPSPWNGDESHTAVGKIFKEKFCPMTENCFYDIDSGFCTSEQLGSVAEISKRYSLILPVSGGSDTQTFGFAWKQLDDYAAWGVTNAYNSYLRFRRSFFGQWRAAFFFRSGGYRWRYYSADGTKYLWSIVSDLGGTREVYGSLYPSAYDNVARLTVPQNNEAPFQYLGTIIANNGLDIQNEIGTVPPVTSQYITMIAAGDDEQYGLPILPRYQTTAVSSEDIREKRRSVG